MNLSDNIMWFRKLKFHPAKSQLEEWSEQARKLEDRVAKAQQDENDSEARAENLNDKLRATKAELEGCRVAYKGKKEQVDGLYGQLRERDRLIVALKQEGEHLRRSISENANTVALNKHIANLTSENQRQKNTIRQLEDQNKNLEAALVKAEGQVRCLQGVVDTQTKMFHAAPPPGHDLSVRLERQRRTIDELREELAKVLKKQSDETERADSHFRDYQRVCQERAKLEREASGLECLLNAARGANQSYEATITNYMEEVRKLKEKTQQYDTDITARNADVRWLSKEREELKEKLEALHNCNDNQGDTIAKLIDARNYLQRKLEQMTQRNDNQSVYITEYQQEVRQLKEQLETEKAKVGPERDIYKDSKLEVRLLNDGVVEVLEYPADSAASPRRLRQTRGLIDWRTKVARREVELTRWVRTASITEYDQWNGVLARHNNVPVKVN